MEPAGHNVSGTDISGNISINPTNVQQRLKEAIDSRITEEQARQRGAVEQARSSPSRGGGGTVRRSASNARSPAGRPGRRKDGEGDSKTTFPNGKAPDPAEFEPEFVIGDDEPPSRSVTPRIQIEDAEKPVTNGEGDDDGQGEAERREEATEEGEETEKPQSARDVKTAPTHLSLEVRKRLVRLEKLEPKYQGAKS